MSDGINVKHTQKNYIQVECLHDDIPKVSVSAIQLNREIAIEISKKTLSLKDENEGKVKKRRKHFGFH